ncbi:leishmanolysin-like peptidase [Haliotis rufescens]|uniref:leishmanolysin-like peptidase n=1 Tax=Haliotis rufescens TaxID=6454 RepID=UPI001EB03802|nr:leishmanolysin-like peptidase [Haliotis rufescens]
MDELQKRSWHLTLTVLWCLTARYCCHVVPLNHQTCGHSASSTHQHEVFYDVNIEPGHVLRKRSVDQPLRIHLHYDDSLRELPDKLRKLVQETVVEAVQFWQDTLKVRGTGAPIRLRKQCHSQRVRYNDTRVYCVGGCASQTVCGDIIIPEEHLEGCHSWDQSTYLYDHQTVSGAGVNNTDFILYVAAVHSQRCKQGNTIAYAAHCQQERVLDRPVAGYFSICPKSLSLEIQEKMQLLSTMKHEILHALGFTAGLYAFYRDQNGDPLTDRNPLSRKPFGFNRKLGMYVWSTNVVKKVKRKNWKLKTGTFEKDARFIVTPKVTKEVRRHFNCSTLEGAELEDQGIDGTALTHWEKRVFENEAMTGAYTQNSVISRITLAMMEDTGWYQVKYENAGNFEWGKNLGCDFVQKSCYEWIEIKQQRHESIYPYCEQVRRGELWTDCSNNRHSVALCNLVEYKAALEPRYQYFSYLKGVATQEVKRFGGSVKLADYCPYLQEFSWTSSDRSLRGSSCRASQNNVGPESNFFGEKYGNDSKCFNHADRWYLQRCYSMDSPQHSGSGCYQFHCSSDNGLIVQVAKKSYRCYHQGQVLNVEFVSDNYLHKGSIVCPTCQHVCDESGITCPPDEELPQIPVQVDALQAPCAADKLDTTWLLASLLTSIVCLLVAHS